MSLMIVESPAKAKTIGRYFDKKMQIVASFGHVRDLPTKKSAIDVNNDFLMHYQIPDKSKKYVEKLKDSASKHSTIYLATDPDREGEAIAWHILEILKSKDVIKESTVVKRVVFNEITKEATNNAVKNCRDIDMDLVNSQQARRAIDHLFGLSVSELLWVTLPGSRSAGRVQSVALRLVCDREVEIVNFQPQEYWDISAAFNIDEKQNITFFMVQHDGIKFEKFSIPNEETAIRIEDSAKLLSYKVSGIKTKKVHRKPPTPFITSTLQQEASNKLRFSPKKTMMIAQKLYEGIELADKEIVGLITYMRTDGLYMSGASIDQTRSLISDTFGSEYIPAKPRVYKSNVKNSQEAHEAIRPTDIRRTPASLKNHLSSEQLSLYELIWTRTAASQASDAEFEQVTITVESTNAADSTTIFSASASRLMFDGFYKIYGGHTQPEGVQQIFNGTYDEHSPCKLISTEKHQHFTQAPPRYGEASLIKKMEEIGIGRPSTYATIISVIQDRQYAILDSSKNLVPSIRGQVVTMFLVKFLTQYVEYDFTIKMEEQLDLISDGKYEWKELISGFWAPLDEVIKAIRKMDKKSVLSDVDESYFKSIPTNIDKQCHVCQTGVMIISASAKSGIFLGCSNYPECNNVKDLSDYISDSEPKYPMQIGTSQSGDAILLKKGPFGFYIHAGEAKVSLPSTFDPTLLIGNEKLVQTVAFMPITICKHPETGTDIKLGINKFGLFAHNDGAYYTIKHPITEIDKVSIEEILNLIKKSKKETPAKILLGKNSKGKEVYLCDGKYGKYVKSGRTNVSIKNLSDDQVTLAKAIELLEKSSSK